MAYVYQEYPKCLYHPTLAPEGKVFQSAEETAGLIEQGWVDSPAKFPIAVFTDRLEHLDPMAFEQFVADVVRESGEFERVDTEIQVGGFRTDIVASKDTGSRAGTAVAFEVKKVAIATPELVRSAHKQMTGIAAVLPSTRFVLVVSGRLSESAQVTAAQLGMSCWDAEVLFRQMNDRLAKRWLISMPAKTPNVTTKKVDALQQTLSAIAPGDGDALKYQRWISDVLEFLFIPPLGPVHYEDSDAAKRNRRDLILENWAPDGFWAQLRSAYAAEQIVVDAKNFSKPIGKRSVIELSHYLKPYGCGMFGMIFTRQAPSNAADHAQREEWIGGRKMILVLDDSIVFEMLRLKTAGARAEEVLRDRIGRFRKSL